VEPSTICTSLPSACTHTRSKHSAIWRSAMHKFDNRKIIDLFKIEIDFRMKRNKHSQTDIIVSLAVLKKSHFTCLYIQASNWIGWDGRSHTNVDNTKRNLFSSSVSTCRYIRETESSLNDSYYTCVQKKHPITFSSISPWVMCRFKQKLQWIYLRKSRFWPCRN